MELGLRGRRALITGGSAGIGYAVARQLAQEGCGLVLVARDPDRLALAADQIRSLANVPVETVAADVGTDAVAPMLAGRFGDADIVVNNAGAIPAGDIGQVDQARFRAGWELKVFGFVGVTRAFYGLMQTRRAGVIINVIGASGERVDPEYIAGSAGNAALMAITHALGADGPRYGLRVVGVNPGPVATGRMEGVLRERAAATLGDAERWTEFAGLFPFGRMIKPEEVAALVAFLASDLSAYTSGTCITIDGGMSKRHQWWPLPPDGRAC